MAIPDGFELFAREDAMSQGWQVDLLNLRGEAIAAIRRNLTFPELGRGKLTFRLSSHWKKIVLPLSELAKLSSQMKKVTSFRGIPGDNEVIDLTLKDDDLDGTIEYDYVNWYQSAEGAWYLLKAKIDLTFHSWKERPTAKFVACVFRESDPLEIAKEMGFHELQLHDLFYEVRQFINEKVRVKNDDLAQLKAVLRVLGIQECLMLAASNAGKVHKRELSKELIKAGNDLSRVVGSLYHNYPVEFRTEIRTITHSWDRVCKLQDWEKTPELLLGIMDQMVIQLSLASRPTKFRSTEIQEAVANWIVLHPADDSLKKLLLATVNI